MMAAVHRQNRALFERVGAAYMAAKGLPPPSVQTLQLAQAVAALETSYASPAGWLKNAPGMADSHNYGAIQCPAGSVAGPTCSPATDHNQDGTSYVTFFRKYPTAEDGVFDLFAFLMHPHARPAFLAGSSVSDFVAAMYQDHYFGGVCTKTIAEFGKRAAAESAFRNANGATSSAGAACDDEVLALYSATVKRYVDEIADAMHEEPVPLGGGILDGPIWPLLAVLGVAAAGAAGWYVWRTYYAAPKKNPAKLYRRNASKAEWRQVYASTCGTERAQRRELAAAEIKKDLGEIKKSRRVELREHKRGAAARARMSGRKAEADRPCDDAKSELRRRTAQDEREASERRTPAQRRSSAQTLERQREKIEDAANDVEATIRRDYGGDLAKVARKKFIAAGARYLAAARKETARHPRSVTTPAEIFIEDFAEDIDNMRAELDVPEPEDESEEEYRERMEYAERRAS
jgi:hypothetical protein